MIDKAVLFLQKHLNARLTGDSVQDKVALAKLQRDYVELALEAVTIVLVGLEPDAMSRSVDPYRATPVLGGSGPVYPEMRLNLYLLFAARFEAYQNALGFLSKIIQHFQQSPVLTGQNAPEMPPEIDRLILELHELPVAHQNDLWSSLKVAACPAVVYRVKMVIFPQSAAAASPKVTELGQEVTAP